MKKRLGVILLLLSSYELVYGQCLLSVGLTQFQNLYSLEIRQNSEGDDLFCCCDGLICQSNASQLISLNTCGSNCDTYFILSYWECQDLSSPCTATVQATNISANSDTTTDVNYDFLFYVSISAMEQVAFEIEMRDYDDASSTPIDTFDITATFPSDNQEQVFTGNKGIATITLTYDLICIEPNACTTAVASPDLTGMTSVVTSTQFITVTSITITTYTEVLSLTTTSTEVQSVTSTQIINSTSTTITTSTSTEVETTTAIINSTSTTIATSTSTEVESVTKTATVSTTVTISATPTAITVNSSLDEPVGEQSAGLSDSISIIWISLFILFALLTIVAVMINIYLACQLKKKKKKSNVDSKAGDIALAQANPLYKQTIATLESDTGEITCSGNTSYGIVDVKSDGFKNAENGNEDYYEYLQSSDT